MKKATITYRLKFGGEFIDPQTIVVENEDNGLFYATFVGTIKGLANTGGALIESIDEEVFA